MLMLAFVFQTLSRRKPDIDAGVYAYAKVGFGGYPGFLGALVGSRRWSSRSPSRIPREGLPTDRRHRTLATELQGTRGAREYAREELGTALHSEMTIQGSDVLVDRGR